MLPGATLPGLSLSAVRDPRDGIVVVGKHVVTKAVHTPEDLDRSSGSIQIHPLSGLRDDRRPPAGQRTLGLQFPEREEKVTVEVWGSIGSCAAPIGNDTVLRTKPRMCDELIEAGNRKLDRGPHGPPLDYRDRRREDDDEIAHLRAERRRKIW